MIIGHGDIAKVLKDRDGAILFASGVSNSLCADEAEYLREKKMIEAFSSHRFNKCFFYFSTISIFFKTSRYTKHKEEMETLVRASFHNYNIIRLGNITWGTNPNTFLNYLKDRIEKGWHVDVRDEIKYMISQKLLLEVVGSLPLEGSRTLSIFGDAMKVSEVLKEYSE